MSLLRFNQNLDNTLRIKEGGQNRKDETNDEETRILRECEPPFMLALFYFLSIQSNVA